MSQTAPASDRTDNRAANSPLVPPDERFWQRYSPHAEMPLSSVGSFAIHALLFGILGLLAFLGTLFFNQGNRALPVEAVRLDLGGGGGNPRGHGDGPNNGAPVEAAGPAKDGPTEDVPSEDNLQPKKINVPSSPQVKVEWNSESKRIIQQTNTDAARAFSKLSRVTANIPVRDAKPSGRGQGGIGDGGGSGDGHGSGTGNGRGEGKGTLSKRQKRMIRWSMGFTPSNAQDYLGQLQGLGAILAVPIREHANGSDYQPSDYKTIRNLSARPPKLHEEDISQLNRIYWFDNDSYSAAQVMNVLRLPLRPSHFIAFMPKELEDRLYKLEKDWLDTRYPGHTEDDILTTKFRINREGGKYEPVMQDLKIKK
jgi:hypothetical protein